MVDTTSRSFKVRLLKMVRKNLMDMLIDELGQDRVSYDTKETAIVIKNATVEEVKEALLAPNWRKNLFHWLK